MNRRIDLHLQDPIYDLLDMSDLTSALRSKNEDYEKLGTTILKTLIALSVFNPRSTPGEMTMKMRSLRRVDTIDNELPSWISYRSFKSLLGYLYVYLSTAYGYDALTYLRTYLQSWNVLPPDPVSVKEMKTLREIRSMDDTTRRQYLISQLQEVPERYSDELLDRLEFLIKNENASKTQQVSYAVMIYNMINNPSYNLELDMINRQEEEDLLRLLDTLPGTDEAAVLYNRLLAGVATRRELESIKRKIARIST